jgi:serine/threonine protein kinase
MDYVGRTILGYHLVKQLGKGSYASVYLGERAPTREQVAIKIFNDGSNFAEIREEAERMARLGGHPHIVRVLPVNLDQQGNPNYVGRDESQRLFLVMEFAAHGSLRMIMRPGQPFLLRAVVTYVKQIAAALQAIHDAGMIHRDIKPNNILLSENNQLLVTDFGIARDIVGGVHHTLNVTGTMGYMGPEQLRGSPTARSDQYALAVIAYELLTCHKPIEEEPDAGILYQIEHAKNALPTHPIQWNPALLPAVDAVIMRGLEKDEYLRFPSVTDFANDLDEAAQGRVPHSISVSRVPTIQAQASTDSLTPQSSTTKTEFFGSSIGGAATGGARVGLCVLPHEIHQVRWSSYGPELVVLTRERPPATVTRPRQTVPTGTQQSPMPGPHQGTTTTAKEVDATIHLWDPNHQQPSVSYALTNGQLSPNGAYVARPVGKTIEVHNLQAQQQMPPYTGHTGAVKKIAWSPDTRYIASTDEDHAIRVWDAFTGNLLNTWWSGVYQLHAAAVTSLAWSPLAERIASYDQDGSLQMWNAISGDKMIDAPQRLRNLVFIEWQPGDRARYILLATRDSIRLWDTDNNILKEPYPLDRLDQQVVRWSPDGRYLAARTKDDEVTVWSIGEHPESATGLKTVALCTCKSSVHSLTWSPSGAVLAIGEIGVVEIWSSQAEVPIFVYEQHIRRVTALDWSPDGRLIASGGLDKQVHVWKADQFIPKATTSPFERTMQKTGYLRKSIRQRLGQRKARALLVLATADAVLLPVFVIASLPAVWIPLGFLLPYPAVGLAAYRLWKWRPANTKPLLGKWQSFFIATLLTALWASAAWALGTVFLTNHCLLPLAALVGLVLGLRVHTSMLAALNNQLKPKS